MARNRKRLFLLRLLFVIAGIPLVLLFLGDFPERTLLKESLSFLTILSFFMIIGQFYWSRVNYNARTELTGKKLLTAGLFNDAGLFSECTVQPSFTIINQNKNESLTGMTHEMFISIRVKDSVSSNRQMIVWLQRLVIQ